GTPIPKWESVDSRETEEEDCYDEITISSGKELRVEQPKVASSFDTTTISTTITTTTATSEECSFVPASMLVNSHDVAFNEKKKDLEKMASELIKTNKSEGFKKSEGGEDDDYEEGEASDNSVTSSDNYKQIKEMIVIKSEVENSSKDDASIIERRKLGTIRSKNPISALNELYLRLEYKEICKSSLPHDPTFTIALELNSQHFEISGRSKKHTKHLTAESTLKYLVQFRIENEVVQALGSNCPKKVEFVGDSSTCNIGSSPEFKESVQRASFNKQGKDGSGRSKEQKATPSQTVKNPIMLLNELRKGVEYKTLEESSDLQCFEGTCSKKKLSKAVAAKEVLSKLFGVIIPSPMDLQYVPLTSHLNFHIPKNLVDKIVKSVCEKLFFLTSEKSTPALRKIQQTRQYKCRRKGKVRTRRYQVAEIIQRRYNDIEQQHEYYVHYQGLNRRLDEWVTKESLKLIILTKQGSKKLEFSCLLWIFYRNDKTINYEKFKVLKMKRKKKNLYLLFQSDMNICWKMIDLSDLYHRGSTSLTGSDVLNDQTAGRKITRNQKRKHDEINHIQKVHIPKNF
ncbi:Double-stranded RNA-specific editase 1, partial [Armadillidium nasatum]